MADRAERPSQGVGRRKRVRDHPRVDRERLVVDGLAGEYPAQVNI